eukprot:GHVQ01024895.1.p4 GENE.GHVQ01024895.1~~GHVQ01024895.1.p4  ORF type:complete len:124 (-),score=18.22 GHVQ01024895.1:905-1276(-)
MGFLIVFDSHDNKSFDEAICLHTLLTDELERRNERLRPVIFLVAAKTDKDPESEMFTSIIGQSEAYSAKTFTRLWKVSAMDGRNIKKMFKDMMYLIQGNELLWQIEIEEEEYEEEEEQECSIM